MTPRIRVTQADRKTLIARQVSFVLGPRSRYQTSWPERFSRILGKKRLRRCRRGWLSRGTSLRFRLALFRCFLQLASRMTFARCQSDTRDEQNKTEFLHVGIECMGG